MSASTDRRKRQEAIAAGTDRKTIAALEEEKKKKKSKAKWTFGTIVVVLLVALILILNSSLFYTGTTAVQIGDESYNTAQFQYYFKTQYFYFVNQYGSYASYFGLDTKSPLKSQDCTMMQDGGSWFDYFKEQALTYMTQVTAMSEYAKENGIELDEADKADIDVQISELATQAESNGYISTDKYIAALYGRGCNEKIIRGEMERVTLASKAFAKVQDDYEATMTPDQLESYYQENKDTYDMFSYEYYLVAAEQVETTNDTASATDTDSSSTTTAVTDETMAAAKETADKIAEAAQKDDFSSAVSGVVADAEATTADGTMGSSVSGPYAEWLKDATRKVGDVTVVESENVGYYVVRFDGRSDNHYNMAQVRHILVKAVADEEGKYTDEAKQTALESAQKIYDQWKSGEMTEDSFASLAEEYSEDDGSKANGGLYDSVHKGQMVAEFDAFCFDASRKPGDTGIVYGESSGYAGYHVMYYVGQGDLYSNYLAENALASEHMNTWQSDLVANYTAVEKFALKFASSN